MKEVERSHSVVIEYIGSDDKSYFLLSDVELEEFFESFDDDYLTFMLENRVVWVPVSNIKSIESA